MNNDPLLTHNIGDLVMSVDKNNNIILGYIISHFNGNLGTYYEVEWIHGQGYMYYGYGEIIKMKGELLRFKEEKSID